MSSLIRKKITHTGRAIVISKQQNKDENLLGTFLATPKITGNFFFGSRKIFTDKKLNKKEFFTHHVEI